MHIEVTPIPGQTGTAKIQITDLPHSAQSIAVRFVTPLTPDNELGFKQVQSYKRSAGWTSVITIVPGGFPSNLLINVYCQEQNSNQTQDVAQPSNAQPIICD